MIVKQNEFVEFKFDKLILYITIIKNIEPTNDEFNFTITTMNSFYEAAKLGNYKFSIIFDIKNLAILPKNLYNKWANYFKENRKNTKLYIHKTAIICINQIAKATLNVFFKMYKSERPVSIVSSIADAITFAASN